MGFANGTAALRITAGSGISKEIFAMPAKRK